MKTSWTSKTLKKVTVEDILDMPTGEYIIEILPEGYNVIRVDSARHIVKTMPDTVSIVIHDSIPKQEMPVYISEPQKSMFAEHKYIEPQFERINKLGLELCVIPVGTKFYKGMNKMKIDEPTKKWNDRSWSVYRKRSNVQRDLQDRQDKQKIHGGNHEGNIEGDHGGYPDNDVSFYTFDPTYALGYTAKSHIGGVFAFKADRPINAFLYTHKNIKRIYDIVSGDIPDAVVDPKILEYIRNALVAQCATEYDDIVGTILIMSKFYLIESPWVIYKDDLRANKDLCKPCANKIYNAKIDRVINPLLLELGKLMGFECTYQETEFVPFAVNSVFNNEIVFYTDNCLIRDTDDPFDVHNWKLSPMIKGTSIESRSIKTLTDANKVYKYFVDNIQRSSTKIQRMPQTYRIGSYNIHGMKAIDTNISIDKFAQKIVDMLRSTDADILFLEEYPTAFKELVAPGYTFVKDNMAGGRLTIGCFIKNDLLKSWRWTEFGPMGTDNYNDHSKKGYLTLELTNKLIVVGVHLTIYVGDSQVYRRHEFDTIKKMTNADIVIGDFNDTIENIDATNYIPVAFSGNTTPFNRVDHVFIKDNSGVTAKNNFVIKTNVSDHLPIFVDVAACD